VVSYEIETFILQHACTQPTCGRFLQYRVFFFLEFRFTIRGGQELHKVRKEHFTFGSDIKGPYVCYDETTSKNYKVTLKRNQPEDFRPPVTIRDVDVVTTLAMIMERLPKSAVFIFMQVIDNATTETGIKKITVWGRKRLETC
jgi:hypothetical protein